jgi:energy-coupling factor transport system permease protein
VFEQLYLERGSILHRLDFWTKLLCLLVVIPVATFLAPLWVLLPISLCFVLLVLLSKIELRLFWSSVRLYWVWLTVAVMVLSMVFSAGALLNRAIVGSVLSAKFAILIGLGVLFSMITDPMEIPIGLLRARIPHRYGVVVMVAFRMIPLITDRLNNVVVMQKARGARFRLSVLGLPRFARELASLAIPAVYLTLEISVGLSDTLLARGYDPSAHAITIPPARLTLFDVTLALLCTALLLLAVWPH